MALLAIIAAAFLVRCAMSAVWASRATRMLGRSSEGDRGLRDGRRLVILLPVLHETGLVQATLQHLLDLPGGDANVEIWVIGSARERDAEGGNPTLDIARGVAIGNAQLRVIEDPREAGAMAHQLNYAVDMLRREEVPGRRTWILLLNIDSRVSGRALHLLFSGINRDVAVIQQSAVFLANLSRLGWLARGVALWQSRWTIVHEARRFARYRRCRLALVHVVGHGLCISVETLARYHRFPEDTITEDLHLGFYLSAHAEEIEHIPILEMADSPETVLEALRQKYVWSFGPLLYPRYFALLLRKFPNATGRVKVRAMIQMGQGVISFFDWAVVSWCLAGLLMVSVFYPVGMLLLAAYFVDYAICLRFFQRAGLAPSIRFGRDMCAILVAGLLHSWPANQALLDLIRSRAVVKHKTRHA